MKHPSALGVINSQLSSTINDKIHLQNLLWPSYVFRVLSHFEDQTETSDKFLSRWEDSGEGGGWLKESKKPEPDFYITTPISARDERLLFLLHLSSASCLTFLYLLYLC